MRPLKLYIHGINSFSTPAFIDFEALGEGGIFGIFGKTGSGKSTIVDAVIFALYGDTNDSALNLADYINRRMNEAEVRLEFTTTETDGSLRFYEVYRKIAVDRRTGAAKATRAELFDITSERISVAVDSRDVTDMIESILGLTLQEFSNCVVLEQNKYDNFVKSTDAERKKMVGNLFGLQKYGAELAEEIKTRETDLKLEISDLAGRIKEHEDATEESVEMLRSRYRGIKETAEKLKAEADRLRKQEAVDAEAYRNYETTQKIKMILDRESAAEKEADKASRNAAQRYETVSAQAAEKIADACGVIEEMVAEQARLEANAGIDADIKAVKDGLRPLEREFKKISDRYDDDAANIDDCAKVLTAYPERKKEQAEHVRALTGIAAKFADENELLDALSRYAGAVEEKAAVQQKKASTLAGTERILAQKTEEVRRARAEADAAENRLDGLRAEKTSTYMMLELSETDLVAARRDNSVSAAIAQLHAGDSCPICGHTIERLSKVDVSDIDRLEAAAEDFRVRVKQIDEELLHTAQAFGTAKTAAANLEAEIGRLAGETQRMRIDQGEGVASYEEIVNRCNEITANLKALLKVRTRTEKEHTELVARHRADTARKKELSAKLAAEHTRLADLDDKRIGLLGGTQTVTAALKAAAKKRASAEADLENWMNKADACAQEARQKTDALMMARARREAAQGRLEELPIRSFDVNKFEELRARRVEVDMKERDASTETANIGALLERMERDYKLVVGYRKEKDKLDARLAALERIKKMTGGGKLMEWLAEEYIEDFTALASEKLSDLTSGEMELSYTKKGFYIIDNFNNRAERKVATVSGGETFLVSLSLAVAIATKLEERAGARRIEFLFIDEGFGTLSGDKIDLVMDALCALAGRDFMVGFISHVQEMQTRIPRQLIVTREDVDEGSVVRLL